MNCKVMSLGAFHERICLSLTRSPPHLTSHILTIATRISTLLLSPGTGPDPASLSQTSVTII